MQSNQEPCGYKILLEKKTDNADQSEKTTQLSNLEPDLFQSKYPPKKEVLLLYEDT